MTVSELIERLKTVPPDLPVGTNYFGAINGVWVSEREPRDTNDPSRVVYLSQHQN